MTQGPAATTPATTACAGEDAIVSLAHVTLSYGDLRALDDVSLNVRRGERLCVLGANGSGKSTLASVICGLLAPDAGEVALVGEKAFANGAADFDAYRRARRKLGLVFQNPEDQIVTSVVEEDVAFGPENLGLPPERIEHLVRRELHRVAMERYAKADPARLSGGQKQRLCIARAVLRKPKILILDDSTSAVDTATDAKIRGALKTALPGTTKLIIAQRITSVMDADLILVMDDGHISATGTHEELMAQSDIYREVYRSQQEGVSIDG